jgi:hypothetical protein
MAYLDYDPKSAITVSPATIVCPMETLETAPSGK